MRKLLSIVLFTFLLVISWSVLRPSESRLVAQDYGSRLFQSHQYDSPIASLAIAYGAPSVTAQRLTGSEIVQAPSLPVESERVTYGNVDGEAVVGFLARPTKTTEPLPALIVIHEWWGLNENIEMMTRRLAGEGYTALAVDLFNGSVADNPERAREQVRVASQNRQLLEENLRQAYQYLESKQQASKIASIGWCFGGSWSLNTALLLPEQLDATVIYYGGELETNPEQLQPLQMPILGIFGALDNNPSVETVHAFESALKSLDKPVEVYIYEGADHAFANPSGTGYNAEAAEDAWQKTIAFLNKHLK